MNRNKSEAVKLNSFQDLGRVFKTADVAPRTARQATPEQREVVCPACNGAGKAYAETREKDHNQLSML